jgi:hypothetical protein
VIDRSKNLKGDADWTTSVQDWSPVPTAKFDWLRRLINCSIRSNHYTAISQIQMIQLTVVFPLPVAPIILLTSISSERNNLKDQELTYAMVTMLSSGSQGKTGSFYDLLGKGTELISMLLQCARGESPLEGVIFVIEIISVRLKSGLNARCHV